MRLIVQCDIKSEKYDTFFPFVNVAACVCQRPAGLTLVSIAWCVCVSTGGVSSPKIRDGEARIFVALFSYEPATMSPNPDAAEEELPFSEGQIIKVRPCFPLAVAETHPGWMATARSFFPMMSFARFTETKIQMASTGESVAVAWALCPATWCLRSRWRTRRPGSSSCSRATCPQQHPWTTLVSRGVLRPWRIVPLCTFWLRLINAWVDALDQTLRYSVKVSL